MGEQHRLAESRFAVGGGNVESYAGQRGQLVEERRIQRQRHERRPRLDDLKTELLGDFVAETRGAHLRNRLAAARHD